MREKLNPSSAHPNCPHAICVTQWVLLHYYICHSAYRRRGVKTRVVQRFHYGKARQDPDQTYKDLIAPKKAILEKWYIKNVSIYLYLKLIFLTIFVVLFPNIDIKRFIKINSS